MKVAVLTSSRADFGIYLPLLIKIQKDIFFDLTIIAFGTHLSKSHGETVAEIEKYNFKTIIKIETPTENNSPKDVSKNISKTIELFSEFWSKNKFDLIFALGDRYEMFAAVTAATSFILNLAHIHAGETTLGAIDNIYRHSISLMSNLLFVSTEEYLNKAQQINTEAKTFNVGALSNDNLKNNQLLTVEEFKTKFNIDLSIPTILTTLHPETVSFEKNIEYTHEVLASFETIGKEFQVVLTLPNADTMGDEMRKIILDFSKNKKYLKIVESFGMIGYLSCMKHCSMLLGNTSSGFVEAAFFPKWVINIGNRQKGRIITNNILNIDFNKENIIEKVKFAKNKKVPLNCNIYGEGNTSTKIIEILKNIT